MLEFQNLSRETTQPMTTVKPMAIVKCPTCPQQQYLFTIDLQLNPLKSLLFLINYFHAVSRILKCLGIKNKVILQYL